MFEASLQTTTFVDFGVWLTLALLIQSFAAPSVLKFCADQFRLYTEAEVLGDS